MTLSGFRGFKAAALAAGLLLLTASIFAFGFFYGREAAAAGTDPGSDADPVVSKSYVDQLIGLTVVQIKADQTLIAEGGAEIILRAGKAVVVETTGNGLSDVTDGKDLRNGQDIPPNHLLIVSRSDGRGLKAATDGWVAVRGAFEIK